MSVTFDRVLPIVRDVLARFAERLPQEAVVINRDLHGRVRLIADANLEDDEVMHAALLDAAQSLTAALGPYGVPAASGVLFEADLDAAIAQATVFPLPEAPVAYRVADRLAVETDWGDIQERSRVPRVVFYSVKGGVGRSTALAATAWALAERGERVLVVDLDLESPGLSSAVLAADRRPNFGLVDWLVEDLVDNGAAVAGDVLGVSDLHPTAAVHVLPAHGALPGAYVTKLGRAWVSSIDHEGQRTTWSTRLSRLLDQAERESEATVVLVDARSGLDEIAALSLGGIGAGLVLAFAIDGEPIWTAYRTLFDHWRTLGVADRIRDRLKVVAALAPEEDPVGYLDRVREEAWDVFRETLYDEIPTATEMRIEAADDPFSFDLADEAAPHAPWLVRRAAGFAALHALNGRLRQVDPTQVTATFGPLVEGVVAFLDGARQDAR